MLLYDSLLFCHYYLLNEFLFHLFSILSFLQQCLCCCCYSCLTNPLSSFRLVKNEKLLITCVKAAQQNQSQPRGRCYKQIYKRKLWRPGQLALSSQRQTSYRIVIYKHRLAFVEWVNNCIGSYPDTSYKSRRLSINF